MNCLQTVFALPVLCLRNEETQHIVYAEHRILAHKMSHLLLMKATVPPFKFSIFLGFRAWIFAFFFKSNLSFIQQNI